MVLKGEGRGTVSDFERGRGGGQSVILKGGGEGEPVSGFERGRGGGQSVVLKAGEGIWKL